MTLMKSYSISKLLLVVTLLALVLAQVSTMIQLQRVRKDNFRLRYQYGHIEVEDPSKVSVVQFSNPDYGGGMPDGIKARESFRILIPPGARYALQLADAASKSGVAYPDVNQLSPTRSVPLPAGSEIVVSRSVRLDDGVPRVLLSSETELLVDYSPTDWQGTMGGTSTSWPDMRTMQNDFDPGQRIRLFWWFAENVDRGFMVWLEPIDAQDADATSSDASSSDASSSDASSSDASSLADEP